MTWFEALTGCSEHSAEDVREDLVLDGPRLRSRRNGQSWFYGELETPTLAQLRERAQDSVQGSQPITVREVIANVQHLHQNVANQNALFQVASQFNLLEMMAPDVTPEWGVGIYERDPTQGPACAIAAGAGTIFRNYFVDVNGRPGQTEHNQIDCLAGVGTSLGNTEQRLASYEAAICAAIVNAKRTGNSTLFLTLVGGGAFGNELGWIVNGIRRSLNLYSDSGLDITLVSRSRSNPCVQQLVSDLSGKKSDRTNR